MGRFSPSLLSLSLAFPRGEEISKTAQVLVCASSFSLFLSPLEQVSGVFMVRGASWSEEQRGFPQARVELPAAVGMGRSGFSTPAFGQAPPTELRLATSSRAQARQP